MGTCITDNTFEKNKVNSERFVIRTINGKKLIVENTEIAYERFEKRIQSEVRSECLFGFK